MYLDAEERLKELMAQNEMQGRMFKMENGPRIIGSEKGPGKGIGNFIRKTSIDELPQLWNILKGDMSIIGPRPALWNQYDLIEERDKYGANDVMPGLTGWAQINGRDELDIPEKAKLDGEYVKQMGFVMDVKCFLGTIAVLLKSDGVAEGGIKSTKEGKE